MSLQHQVVLRFRGRGHLRFGVPDKLCEADAAERLQVGLLGVGGIYRVDLYHRQRKLAIRYRDELIDHHAVAAAVAALTDEIEHAAPTHAAGSTGMATTGAGDAAGAHGGVQDAPSTVVAIRGDARNSLGAKFGLSSESRKFVGEFLVDVLVLYLIKAHWHLITQHWLKRPWQYRYEWLAALYMIFLLVRSKKPK